ncbi:hypothetical protein [Idiomarina abyssalis]|uniref:hypothetical protein n=1 Tax=Idiomarina abyssalis TaxID=86102 RepID=UPI003A958608
MPMFQGFCDSSRTVSPKKFVLRVRALDLDTAREVFEAECSESESLTAITEQVGEKQIFRHGEPFDSVTYGFYLKNVRELPPTDELLDSREKGLEKLGEVVAEEPNLDKLARRNPVPFITPIIQVIGWIVLVCDALVVIFFLNSGELAVQVLATIFLPTLVAGLLLIAVAWGIKVLNRIMVVTQYQAELAQYRHHQEQVSTAEMDLENMKQQEASGLS